MVQKLLIRMSPARGIIFVFSFFFHFFFVEKINFTICDSLRVCRCVFFLGMAMMGQIVLGAWLGSGHPDRLDYLEDGGSDDDKDEQGQQFGRDGIALVLFRRLRNIASFGNILGVLFASLSHPRCGRHLGFVICLIIWN